MRVLLHPGFPKTATTYLQQHVFLAHPNVMTPFGLRDHESIVRRLEATLVEPPARTFDASAARKLILAAHPRPEGACLVISLERLAGGPHGSIRDRRELVERVVNAFPEARALIVIREQVDAILSMYKHYVAREHGTVRLSDYVAEVPPILGGGGRTIDYWRYSGLITLFQDHLGDDRVRVVLYERMRADMEAEVNAIFAWLGLAELDPALHTSRVVNPSFSDVAVRAMRLLNYFFAPPPDSRLGDLWVAPITRLPGRRQVRRFWRLLDNRLGLGRVDVLRHQVRRAVGSRFVEDNSEIERRLRLPLTIYGYATLGPVADGRADPDAPERNETESPGLGSPR